MNTHNLSRVLIRISPAQKAWVAYTAAANNRSQNSEIASILEAAMKADPLRVFVHTVAIRDQPTVYAASLGEFGKDFHEGRDRDAVVAAAMAKARELGLPRSAVVFNTVSDNAA